MAVERTFLEHTFPPEIWEFICAELAEQKQPSPPWSASVTSITLPARDALRALGKSSKMLRCIAQPLLLQYYNTEDEVEGLGSFCRNILAKPQLASLVRGLEVASCPLYAVDPEILYEVASRFRFSPGVFDIPRPPSTPTSWKTLGEPGRKTVTDLSLLANLVPRFLPNLKCLQVRLGTHRGTRLFLHAFGKLRRLKPLESVTTLVLSSETDLFGAPDGCMLTDHEPLFSALPNLQTLSLWNFKRLSHADNLYGPYAAVQAWRDPTDDVGQWLPPGLRSLHMQNCVLSNHAVKALLLNCRALEHLLYAPEDASSHHIVSRQAVAYFEIVQLLRAAAGSTIRYLDLDIGGFKRRTYRHMLDSDLAAMWKDIHRLPHIERVTVDGDVYQCKEKTPQEDEDTYSSPSDWILVKASGYVGERARHFQLALDQASGF
ncbi:hypothetical protein PG991_001417 [Apiospora marii]|uniref:F-box domain-containing protein n=1 Tax=Apiospora marii TaxID=335849 RepID=A0ABR1SS10_9PEZI